MKPDTFQALRDYALAIARAELAAGAREIGGENEGPFVKKYAATVHLEPPIPWCSAFVCWIFDRAAQKLDVALPFTPNASALSLWEELKQSGYSLNVEYGPKTGYDDYPREGDLAFWKRGPSFTHTGHTGIVEYAHNQIGGHEGVIQTIEGNHADAVARVKHIWTAEPLFVGFARIDFAT